MHFEVEDHWREDDGSDVQRGLITDGSVLNQVTPCSRRQCTDGFCLLLFLSFCGTLGAVYQNARQEGNLAKLTHGYSWEGKVCGVDDGFIDRPLLYWCTPGETDLAFLDGICVSKCPTGPLTSSSCPGQAKPFELWTNLSEKVGSPVVKEVTIGLRRTLTMRPDYASSEALGYCFPSGDLQLLRRIIDQSHVSAATKQVYLATHGVINSAPFFIAVACACITIGYVFLFVLSRCFEHLVYGLVIVSHLMLITLIAASVYLGLSPDSGFLGNYLSHSSARSVAWVCAVSALLVWILGTIFFHCYGKESLDATIDTVKATCEVLNHIPSLLLQPLMQSISLFVVLSVLLYGLAWLVSTGRVVAEGEATTEGGVLVQGLHRNMEFTNVQLVSLCFWVFGLVWICETVNALGQFAISHAVVDYACSGENSDASVLRGYYVGIVYHLGTIAFGGFALGFMKVLAALFAFMARLAAREAEMGSLNVCAAAQTICWCCCANCFACIERLLSMVNDLVYTDVALQGTSYITAAENVVHVALSHPVTYAAIKGSATVIRVLGVTIIGGGGTFLSYQALASSSLHKDLDRVFTGASSALSTSSILGVTVVAGMICFYIAISFMMVFYQTTESLMYCMLLARTAGRVPATGRQAWMSSRAKG